MKQLVVHQAGRLRKVTAWRYRARRETDSVRAPKRRESCAALVFANEKLKYQKLELMLAANIDIGDIVAVLTYDDKHLPGSRRDVVEDLHSWRRKLKSILGYSPRMLWCIEGSHSDHVNKGKRYHVHCCMPAAAGVTAAICTAWRKGIVLHTPFELDARKWARGLGIDTRDLGSEVMGYEPLARYMCKEHPEYNGQRTWSYTRGCIKPDTDKTLVDDDYTVVTPKGCTQLQEAKASSVGYEFVKFLVPK